MYSFLSVDDFKNTNLKILENHNDIDIIFLFSHKIKESELDRLKSVVKNCSNKIKYIDFHMFNIDKYVNVIIDTFNIDRIPVFLFYVKGKYEIKYSGPITYDDVICNILYFSDFFGCSNLQLRKFVNN